MDSNRGSPLDPVGIHATTLDEAAASPPITYSVIAGARRHNLEPGELPDLLQNVWKQVRLAVA